MTENNTGFAAGNASAWLGMGCEGRSPAGCDKLQGYRRATSTGNKETGNEEACHEGGIGKRKCEGMEALRSASHLRSAPAGVLFGEPERDRVQADVLQASLARTARCRQLDFHRIDYPQMDPPEWNKFVTIKLRGDKAKSTSCRTDALATLK